MEWDSADDESLIRGIQAGHADAEEAFDRRFRSTLGGLARRRGLSPLDADEVAQETLLAALVQARAGRFEQRSTLGLWVARIFQNRLNDWLRRDIRRRQHLEPLDDHTLLSNEPLGGAYLAPEELSEIHGRLRQALLSLPKRDRAMLLLNVLGRKPVREIAALMNLGQKNAEAIVTAAKKRVREFMRDGK